MVARWDLQIGSLSMLIDSRRRIWDMADLLWILRQSRLKDQQRLTQSINTNQSKQAGSWRPRLGQPGASTSPGYLNPTLSLEISRNAGRQFVYQLGLLACQTGPVLLYPDFACFAACYDERYGAVIDRRPAC